VGKSQDSRTFASFLVYSLGAESINYGKESIERVKDKQKDNPQRKEEKRESTERRIP